jgi:plastocyanin
MKQMLASPGILILGVALFTLAGCAKDMSTNPYGSNPTPTPAPNTIVLSGTAFAPNSKTISAGTTITWKNTDSYVHTSTSDAGVWDTGNIPGGGSRTTTFNAPGTYPYHCTYHAAMGMTGTIVVQ